MDGGSPDAGDVQPEGGGTTKLCSEDLPFGRPESFPLPGFSGGVDATGQVRSASFTDDERQLVISAGADGQTSILHFVRPSASAPFTDTPKTLFATTYAYDEFPTLTPDGETIAFSRFVVTGFEGIHLAHATGGVFGTDPGPAIQSSQPLTHLHATHIAGPQVWMTQSAAAAGQKSTLVRASFVNGAMLTSLEALTTSADFGQSNPVSSHDALTLYFAAAPGGSAIPTSVFVAHRSDQNALFTSGTLVPELASAEETLPLWISADNCRLYLQRVLNGQRGLWLAKRTPPL